MLALCEEQAKFDDATAGPSTPRRPTFTKWERDFLESIRDQYDMRGRLSEKQEDILQQMYDKV
jgi:hypothetical protein